MKISIYKNNFTYKILAIYCNIIDNILPRPIQLQQYRSSFTIQQYWLRSHNIIVVPMPDARVNTLAVQVLDGGQHKHAMSSEIGKI